MDTNFSASQTQDSDDVQEMYCEECEKHDDRYTPAVGFCVDCVEYKCVNCLRYHMRHYKNHTVEEKNTMPQDFYFEKCSSHPKELIKFFCSECEKTACQECKNNDHKNCCNVSHLPTLAKDIKTSTELKSLKENLDKLSNDIKDTKNKLDDKCATMDSLENEAKATVKMHKDKLIATYKQQQNEIIDNFDKKMKETIAKLKKERKVLVEELAEKQSKFKLRISDEEQRTVKAVENSNADFKTLRKKHLALVDDLKKLSAELVQAQPLGLNCKLFLTMKFTERICEKLSQNMQEFQNNFIHHYKVEPKIESKQSIQSLETTTAFFSYIEIHKSAVERTATFHSDIKHLFYGMSSLCLLNESTLLATDYDRCSLAIFKITKKTSQCYDIIELPSEPWDITKLTDNKVAVTFPNETITRLFRSPEAMIRLITFSDLMSVVNTNDIRVSPPCHGIAYSNNNLIVSNEENGTVQILDMSGRIIRTIGKDSNGKPLFTKPWYLVVSPDNTTIYVSDYERHTVISLTVDGKVKAIYKDDQLKHPRQLTVDESGAVYVCGRWSYNVHQLSSDLTKVKILLNKGQGMNSPMSVAYCKNNNTLYVGMRGRNIEVFNLK
ncbi:E3 ubiquitin-protein ligase TRIM71-like [Mercenaria mercenaria]|uniref:E3 ubiquitin-protein ligase TRIM71-like n=1 Tax=Mercenaria mercenaria TaxID=6596 RepID=UPI00234F6A5F|nr:E3 ubiquitin-protein ligase TRIM71-like [Mercenaria mercenaria]